MQHVENEFDITLEKLTQTTTKLDVKEKFRLSKEKLHFWRMNWKDPTPRVLLHQKNCQ